MSKIPDDVHVLPINDLVDHDGTSRTGCWCQPRTYISCPEDCEDGCWRCVRGLVEVDYDNPDDPIIVVHNAADGRE